MVASRSSPVGDMLKYVRYYKLDEKLRGSLTTGVWESRNEIKNMVKKVIWTHEYRCWQASSFCYPELSLYYEIVKKIEINFWWQFTNKAPGHMRKVAGVLSVMMGGQPKGLQRNFNSKKCKLCQGYDSEDLEHILLKCPRLSEIRTAVTTNLLDSMPPAMTLEFESFNNRERLKYLFSGFGGQLISEWLPLYSATVEFVYQVYRERASAYDILSAS